MKALPSVASRAAAMLPQLLALAAAYPSEHANFLCEDYFGRDGWGPLPCRAPLLSCRSSSTQQRQVVY